MGVLQKEMYTEENDFIPWLRDRLGIEAASIRIMERSNSCFVYQSKGGRHVAVPYLRISARGDSYGRIIKREIFVRFLE